jgi:hypothetical protein
VNEFKPGQDLVAVYENHRGERGAPKPVKVTKVGRKWVHISGENYEARFDRESLQLDGGQYSSSGRVFFSMEELRESEESRQYGRLGLSDGLTALRIRLALGMLLMGGDTDPLHALQSSLEAMKRVLPQTRGALPIQDLEYAISLCERLGIKVPS